MLPPTCTSHFIALICILLKKVALFKSKMLQLVSFSMLFLNHNQSVGLKMCLSLCASPPCACSCFQHGETGNNKRYHNSHWIQRDKKFIRRQLANDMQRDEIIARTKRVGEIVEGGKWSKWKNMEMSFGMTCCILELPSKQRVRKGLFPSVAHFRTYSSWISQHFVFVQNRRKDNENVSLCFIFKLLCIC